MNVHITNGEIFNIWILNKRNDKIGVIEEIISYVEEKSKKKLITDVLNQKILKLVHVGRNKWIKAHRTKARFEKNETSWRNLTFNYMEFEDCVSLALKLNKINYYYSYLCIFRILKHQKT